MNKIGKVTPIIKDHVEGFAARERRKRLLDAPSILLLGLAFPSENGDSSSSHTKQVKRKWLETHDWYKTLKLLRGCRMVLGREYVLKVKY